MQSFSASQDIRALSGIRLRALPFLIAASTVLLPPALGAQAPSPVPNEFFKRGTPTFIVGTAGDAFADRAIKAQAVHLYGATASTWAAICKEAGTVPRDLETAFRAKLKGRP